MDRARRAGFTALIVVVMVAAAGGFGGPGVRAAAVPRGHPRSAGPSLPFRAGGRPHGDPNHPENHAGMSRLRERCPGCSRKLIITRFDTTFRLPDRSERLCFGIPGGLCEDCHQLYIDPDLIELLDLSEGRCVFAIESDLVLQEQAWSSTD